MHGWVTLIDEAVSRHEDWGAALDHVAARRGVDSVGLWFSDQPDCAWIFDGQPNDQVDECIARVFDPVQFQRARSRGELEDVPAFFTRRAGASLPDPALQRQFLIINATTMTKTQPAPKTKPRQKGVRMRQARPRANSPQPSAAPATAPTINRLAYVVLEPMMWAGVEKQRGDKLQGTIVGAGVLILQMLKEGRMREFDADEYSRTRAAAATITLPGPKRFPQTVSAELPKKAQGSTANAAPFHANVPTSTIQHSPWNPRKDWTTDAARAELAELMQSIREQGIIEPLIVRPLEGGYFELVAGERRLRAAVVAGLVAVPCIVRELTKTQAIEIQAVENIQRRDLNAIEEGEGYRLMMNEAGYTVPQLVVKLGKSEATIYSRLKLLDCPPGLRTAVIEGRLPASTADLVAREDDATFRAACMDAILFGDPGAGEAADGRVMSFRQAKAWIAEHRATFAVEHDWENRQRESHAFRSAAKVLTVAESAEALLSGGAVRDSQTYVRPTDTCFADEKRRTYADLAEEAGVELPELVLARDPGAGAPVVLLPREATEKALAKIVPDAEEQRHRRAAADVQRRLDAAQAERTRKEAREKKELRAAVLQRRCVDSHWLPEAEETFLRLLVGDRLRRLLLDGAGELLAVLRQFGLDMIKEDEPMLGADWIREYLAGTDAVRLRAWLLYFHLREADAYVENRTSADTIDEDRLLGAEMLFAPTTPAEPRTSAVAGTKG